MGKMKHSILVGLLGNVLEWYDFSLFGYFSPLFAKLFFPQANPTLSLIATFGIFAAGFLMRPLGAVLFGYLGDRFGRKQALFYSVMLICIPTIGMGFLPIYSQAGFLAPLLLILLRMMQGLSTGGEYTSSILFLTEHAPPSLKGFAGSFALFGAGTGMLLGSSFCGLVTYLCPPDFLEIWGWRIPFWLGALTAAYGLFVRRQAMETAPFLHLQSEQKIAQKPLQEVIRQHKTQVLQMIGLNLLSTIAGYLIYAYMPTYLHQVMGMPLSQALFLNACFLGFYNFLVPIFGWLSDLFGRKPLFLFGASAFILFSYPLFWLFTLQNLAATCLAFGLLTCFIACYHAPVPAAMTEAFPVHIRASAVGMTYNIAASLFSGTCPLVASLLIEATGNVLAPAYSLIVGGMISLGTVLLIPQGTSKIGFGQRENLVRINP